MTMLRQQLKERLARRDFVIGINPSFPSTGLVETLARRFDLIFIDCENAGPDVETIPDLARAAHAGGAVALLRPWSKDAGLLRRYLACGIDGLILPDVESAEDVAAVQRVMDETHPADADTLILFALIETSKGVERAHEIMRAPGVDAIQIGTSDLAVSLGLPRRGDHPQVKDIAFRMLAEAKEAGKSAGTPVNKYGMAPVLEAGGNCIMLFMQDVLQAGIDAALVDFPRQSRSGS